MKHGSSEMKPTVAVVGYNYLFRLLGLLPSLTS